MLRFNLLFIPFTIHKRNRLSILMYRLVSVVSWAVLEV